MCFSGGGARGWERGRDFFFRFFFSGNPLTTTSNLLPPPPRSKCRSRSCRRRWLSHGHPALRQLHCCFGRHTRSISNASTTLLPRILGERHPHHHPKSVQTEASGQRVRAWRARATLHQDAHPPSPTPRPATLPITRAFESCWNVKTLARDTTVQEGQPTIQRVATCFDNALLAVRCCL